MIIPFLESDTGAIHRAKNSVEFVVVMEVLLFYFGIFGQIIFLLLSRCFSFKTMRERANLGGNMRYRIDFLDFVKDDIHYFLICFIEAMLYIYMNFHSNPDLKSS